jgi:hypothetical protein
VNKITRLFQEYDRNFASRIDSEIYTGNRPRSQQESAACLRQIEREIQSAIDDVDRHKGQLMNKPVQTSTKPYLDGINGDPRSLKTSEEDDYNICDLARVQEYLLSLKHMASLCAGWDFDVALSNIEYLKKEPEKIPEGEMAYLDSIVKTIKAPIKEETPIYTPPTLKDGSEEKLIRFITGGFVGALIGFFAGLIPVGIAFEIFKIKQTYYWIWVFMSFIIGGTIRINKK